MLRQTTRALAGMGGRAAGASSPGSAFAPHAAAGASWMQNRSIGKVGVPENYGQIDGVGTKFLGTPANHREVRHLPRVASLPSPSRATTRRSTPQTRASLSRASSRVTDNPKRKNENETILRDPHHHHPQLHHHHRNQNTAKYLPSADFDQYPKVVIPCSTLMRYRG